MTACSLVSSTRLPSLATAKGRWWPLASHGQDGLLILDSIGVRIHAPLGSCRTVLSGRHRSKGRERWSNRDWREKTDMRENREKKWRDGHSIIQEIRNPYRVLEKQIGRRVYQSIAQCTISYCCIYILSFVQTDIL